MSQYFGRDRTRLTLTERQELEKRHDELMIQIRCVLVRNFRLLIDYFQLIVAVRFEFHDREFVIDPRKDTVWIDDRLNNKFDPTLWREIDVLEVSNNFDEFLYTLLDAIFDSVNPLCLMELYNKTSQDKVIEMANEYLKEVDPCDIYKKVKKDKLSETNAETNTTNTDTTNTDTTNNTEDIKNTSN